MQYSFDEEYCEMAGGDMYKACLLKTENGNQMYFESERVRGRGNI